MLRVNPNIMNKLKQGATQDLDAWMKVVINAVRDVFEANRKKKSAAFDQSNVYEFVYNHFFSFIFLKNPFLCFFSHLQQK